MHLVFVNKPFNFNFNFNFTLESSMSHQCAAGRKRGASVWASLWRGVVHPKQSHANGLSVQLSYWTVNHDIRTRIHADDDDDE